MARRWTEHDDRLLRTLYAADEPREAIAERLGRTRDAVDARRRLLREPARTAPARRWSEAEEAFLRAATRAGIPSSEIASRLSRTPYAVRRRREVIGATGPRGRPYGADEDALIRAAVLHGDPLTTVARTLGRSEGAIRLHARQLGLISVTKRSRWAPAEDAELSRAYRTGLSIAQIKEQLLPGRTEGAIVARAHLLGLAEHGRRWADDDDARLARLVALGLSSTNIARHLGRTDEAIAKRCRLLDLRAPSTDPPRRRGRWTPREDELLRARADEPVATLVHAFGRSRTSIRRRRRALGLTSPPRTQHHPLAASEPVHARLRAIRQETPLTATRALALAKRLGLPLADIRRLATG